MNPGILKNYLKHDLSGIIISVVFFAVLYFVVKDKSILIIVAGVGLFDFIKGFFKYKKRQDYLAELAAQGLTEQEADDNSFIIKWEKIKKGGILKYCLIDGGMLMGIWLALSVGLVTFLIQPSFFGSPINGFQFIEFTCPIGVFLGISLSFFTWLVN
ncbi:MAG: hypothetical protein ABIN13_03735, partial [Mucilaginibacter sp.]